MIRLILALGPLAWLACGPPSQHKILKQADGVETKQALEEKLGAPDEIDRLGPLETWTYHASDGQVEFLITGNTVALETTKASDDNSEEE